MDLEAIKILLLYECDITLVTQVDYGTFIYISVWYLVVCVCKHVSHRSSVNMLAYNTYLGSRLVNV